MLLDDSDVHLKAGDAVIQRGSNHGWVNRGMDPCGVAVVLVVAADESAVHAGDESTYRSAEGKMHDSLVPPLRSAQRLGHAVSPVP